MQTLRRFWRQLNPGARWGVLVLAQFAALLLASCGGNADPSPTPANTPATPPNGVIRVEVNLHSYKFVPRVFQFNVGDTVEFVLTSTDAVHTFTVKGMGINWVEPGGEAQTQRVTFDRPGEFRLVCTIPQHETLGMTGTIIVN